MRSAYFLGLAALVFIVTTLGFGQAAPDLWLILANGEKGPINLHTTRADLVRAYGTASVVDQDVDIGEGETEPGTVVFPKDKHRAIEILWTDQATKTAPKSATIRGRASRWHAAHGISLG